VVGGQVNERQGRSQGVEDSAGFNTRLNDSQFHGAGERTTEEKREFECSSTVRRDGGRRVMWKVWGGHGGERVCFGLVWLEREFKAFAKCVTRIVWTRPSRPTLSHPIIRSALSVRMTDAHYTLLATCNSTTTTTTTTLIYLPTLKRR